MSWISCQTFQFNPTVLWGKDISPYWWEKPELRVSTEQSHNPKTRVCWDSIQGTSDSKTWNIWRYMLYLLAPPGTYKSTLQWRDCPHVEQISPGTRSCVKDASTEWWFPPKLMEMKMVFKLITLRWEATIKAAVKGLAKTAKCFMSVAFLSESGLVSCWATEWRSKAWED